MGISRISNVVRPALWSSGGRETGASLSFFRRLRLLGGRCGFPLICEPLQEQREAEEGGERSQVRQ